MADTTPRIVTCPHCGGRVKWTSSNAHRPFCSERCKLIDLGAWASGQHVIETNPDEEDLLSGQLDDNT
jgi:endogenous inhibitor of DNA gyrase (YacG/DUF329 family)